MRRMNPLLAGLTALCLLCALPGTAAAWDSDPRLVLQEEGRSISLTLEGLEDRIFGLQLELVLEGSCPDAAFQAEVPDAYVPDCRVEADGEETTVTIYMTASGGGDPLNGGRRLYLGDLEPGGSRALPDRARLTLLDRNLRAYTETVRTGSDFRDRDDDYGFRIYVGDPEHGTLRVRPSSAEEGERVTVTATPDPGYELEELTALRGRRDLSLTDRGGGTYTFTMPDGTVDLEAVFRPGTGEPLPFADVPSGFWCYDEIQYVCGQGLVDGTAPGLFTPGGSTTRGMIVTALYRMEGSPAAGEAAFTDIHPGLHDASAVAWASASGIVSGYSDGTFRPDVPITRQQLAAFLYRYVRYRGGDTSPRADLSAYTDAGGIADYALEALSWANAMELINGTSAATLSPGGTATRAHAAVILARYAQYI